METLLWAGTPHIRTKILLQIFSVWSVLLVIPSLILVEVVPDLGGWLALVRAKLTRASRTYRRHRAACPRGPRTARRGYAPRTSLGRAMCTAYRAMCKRTVAPQAWAVCSVFVFVPYISRGSREVNPNPNPTPTPSARSTLALTLTVTLARGQP